MSILRISLATSEPIAKPATPAESAPSMAPVV
jgi:hypothetical protein